MIPATNDQIPVRVPYLLISMLACRLSHSTGNICRPVFRSPIEDVERGAELSFSGPLNLHVRTCSYNITISENVTLSTTTLETQYFIYSLVTHQNRSQ